MRKAIILIVLITVLGCTSKPPPTKPFIITFKFPESAVCNGGYCRYEYMDANGEIYNFCEGPDAYCIGDTIH